MSKKEEIKENICNCSEECCCDDECTCDEECTCCEECSCEENECACGEDCNCNKEEIETLNKEIFNLKEALLRNQAELQNYKRRKDEETERYLKY